MPPLPADSIHARACKLKCEKILTRPPRCSAPKGLDRQCIELEIVQAAERACCLLSTDGKPFHLAQTDCCLP